MKRKKKKSPHFLLFYKNRMPFGTLNRNGLCNCFGTSFDESTWIPSLKVDNYLRLFFPEDPYTCERYWASGDDYVGLNEHRDFTPLRQNIVLLMACLNNEL